jgi:hypothetical protein
METFVGSAHRHGRKVKIMRSGRHTQPSQVEKVAEKAGKAAPVMAISATFSTCDGCVCRPDRRTFTLRPCLCADPT